MVLNKWVWENFREDYSTSALFQGNLGNYLVHILIVSSQTLYFKMYSSLFDEPFSINVGAMDFKLCPFHCSHITNKLGVHCTL